MIPIDYEGLAIIFSDSKLEGSVLLKKEINRVAFQNFVDGLINRMFDYAQTEILEVVDDSAIYR